MLRFGDLTPPSDNAPVLLVYVVPFICGLALIAAGISVWRGNARRAPAHFIFAASLLILGGWFVLYTLGRAIDFTLVAHVVYRFIYPILFSLALVILGCGTLLWRSGDRRYGAIWLAVGGLFTLFALVAMIFSLFAPVAGS